VLLQDLQQYRRIRHLESLRQAELPPELAAAVSLAAAVDMKQAGRWAVQQGRASLRQNCH
jgi:hypothetical protein